MEKIQKMEQGKGPEGTFLQAAFANRVIGIANGLIGAQVVFGEEGYRFVVTPDAVKLELPPKTLFFGVANGFPACWEFAAKNVPVPEV